MMKDYTTPLPPRRIAAIHDLSCVGRCALTVILPTLSVMGYQTIPLPTALLSSHTGGFDDLTFCDLSGELPGIMSHFERLDLRFGAIYTGFLGSERQIELVEAFLRRFGDAPDETGEAPLIFIDPVMGDDGALYSTYTPALADGIRHLSSYAEVLTPNLTEACILTRTPYRNTADMSVAAARVFVEELCRQLSQTVSPRARIVITGIPLCDGTVANCGRVLDGSLFWVTRPHIGRPYPGTGDVFASVLLGNLMQGKRFSDAVSRAADFTGMLIGESSRIPTPERMGVALEPHLRELIGKE